MTTRSKRQEEAPTDLKRSEFYLREGERLAHMGSWSLKSDGTFDYWSPETFVLFGFDPSEGIPTLPKWLTVLHPDDRDLVAKTLERIFRENVRIDVTYRVDYETGKTDYAQHGRASRRGWQSHAIDRQHAGYFSPLSPTSLVTRPAIRI